MKKLSWNSFWMMALLVALLVVAGAQSVLRFLVDLWPTMQGNYFLEQRGSQSAEEIIAEMEKMSRKSALVSLFAACVSTPLLRYLVSNFRDRRMPG